MASDLYLYNRQWRHTYDYETVSERVITDQMGGQFHKPLLSLLAAQPMNDCCSCALRTALQQSQA